MFMLPWFNNWDPAIGEYPLDWIRRMQTSADYLGIEPMQENMAYSIYARNAYVGIWLPEEQGFLISRYKMNPTPFLFVEYHWDTGESFGTAKPLRPLEVCPLPLLPEAAYHDSEQNAMLCAWLDALEEREPPIPTWDTVGERRLAAGNWSKQQEAKRKWLEQHPEKAIPKKSR